MRNLFAHIQGIRDAQAEGWEEAGDYEMDEEGEYDQDAEALDDVVMEGDEPQEEEDDDEYYEGWGEELEPEQEAPKPKRKASKSFAEDPPSTPKSSKRRKKLRRMSQALRRSKTWASSEANTPNPKLPRAGTDESYMDPVTASKEQQLAEIMTKIESLQVQE